MADAGLRLLADALPALIVQLDANACIQFANATCRHWFGIAPEQVQRQPLAELLGEKPYQRWCTHLGTALAGDQVSFEDRLVTDGERRDLHVTLVPGASLVGGGGGLVALITDITAHRERQDALLDEISHAGHSARVASMSELAATIAHQLGQPLGVISHYAGALKRRAAQDDDTARIQGIADKIATQVHVAGDILNELREFIGRRTVDHKALDLNELARRVLNLTHARIQSTGAQVTLALDEGLPEIVASPVQLEQVLVNLVVNALEAMADSPTRELTVTTERDGDLLHICVADTGHGIGAEHLNRIFDTFYTSKENGMGMGLAICRGIVEEYGGRLWAHSRDGEGAQFHLQLPRKARSAE